jgi:ATP synthase protein I
VTEKHQTPDGALKEIERRLNALKTDLPETLSRTSSAPHPVGRMMWLAFNVISDLIAGVICGFGMGYGLDFWLGTRPVFIAVFLVLGCMAGVLNVVRFLRRYDEKQRLKASDTSEGKE